MNLRNSRPVLKICLHFSPEQDGRSKNKANFKIVDILIIDTLGKDETNRKNENTETTLVL